MNMYTSRAYPALLSTLAVALVLVLVSAVIHAAPLPNSDPDIHHLGPRSLRTNFRSFQGVLAKHIGSKEEDPTFDSQTVTYDANFHPVTVSAGSAKVTPFFSPDSGIVSIVDMIESATDSVELGIPGFSPWSYCRHNKSSSSDDGDDDSGANNDTAKCTGCPVSYIIEHESFPVFLSLMNKLQQGVKVSILTNNYRDILCDGSANPLIVLKMAGAEVRYFDTVTFLHTKYIRVDKKKTSISSVNFSRMSFMQNREAGLLIEENDEIQDFAAKVFTFDYNQATDMPIPSWITSSDYKLVRDWKQAKVVIPTPYASTACAPKTQNIVAPVSGNMDITIIASPDQAFETVFSAVEGINSLDLSIYQITEQEFCDGIIQMSKNGTKVRVFVSYRIFGPEDYAAAQICYKQLTEAGVVVMQAPQHCLMYWHQKFWIINDKTVFLSTGNWSPSDYPVGSDSFPPYSSSSWRHSNRDFTVSVTNPAIVSQFQKVYEIDYAAGQKWTGK